jgi:hypothetical protein
MFYGDYRAGDNARTFLRRFEEDLADMPQLSETKKCHCFYNYCLLGSNTEYWYEELERNSPIVLTSWFTLANHFRVKWLHSSPNLLLESPEIKQITITQSDTATMVLHDSTTTTTATDPIDAMTTDKLQDNGGSAREREEEAEEKKEMGAEEEIPCATDAPLSRLLDYAPPPNRTTIACTTTTDSAESHANEPICVMPKCAITPPNRDVAPWAHNPTMNAATLISPNIPTATSVLGGTSPNANKTHPTALPTNAPTAPVNTSRMRAHTPVVYLPTTPPAPALINPDLIPINPAFASAVPVDPDLISLIHPKVISVKPKPVKPISIKSDNLKSVVLCVHTNCTPTEVFTNQVLIDSAPIHSIPVSTVPVDHVHVDPIFVTSAGLNLITATISFLLDVDW